MFHTVDPSQIGDITAERGAADFRTIVRPAANEERGQFGNKV
jgi:hypothetical protein